MSNSSTWLVSPHQLYNMNESDHSLPKLGGDHVPPQKKNPPCAKDDLARKVLARFAHLPAPRRATEPSLLRTDSSLDVSAAVARPPLPQHRERLNVAFVRGSDFPLPFFFFFVWTLPHLFSYPTAEASQRSAHLVRCCARLLRFFSSLVQHLAVYHSTFPAPAVAGRPSCRTRKTQDIVFSAKPDHPPPAYSASPRRRQAPAVPARSGPTINLLPHPNRDTPTQGTQALLRLLEAAREHQRQGLIYTRERGRTSMRLLYVFVHGFHYILTAFAVPPYSSPPPGIQHSL